jgi:hypothetical protein
MSDVHQIKSTVSRHFNDEGPSSAPIRNLMPNHERLESHENKPAQKLYLKHKPSRSHFVTFVYFMVQKTKRVEDYFKRPFDRAHARRPLPASRLKTRVGRLTVSSTAPSVCDPDRAFNLLRRRG